MRPASHNAGNRWVKRDTCQYRYVKFLDTSSTWLNPKHWYDCHSPGHMNIAMVLYKPNYRNFHFPCHINSLGNYHRNKFLRSCNNNNSVKRQWLNTVRGTSPVPLAYQQTCSQYHPFYITPELFNSTGNYQPLQTTGVSSSSTRRFTDISSVPFAATAGIIPSESAITFSWTPKHFGIEGPVISASSIAVVWPLRVPLPLQALKSLQICSTPPFPLTMPYTCFTLLALFYRCKKRCLIGLELQFALHEEQSCEHSSVSSNPVFHY